VPVILLGFGVLAFAAFLVVTAPARAAMMDERERKRAEAAARDACRALEDEIAVMRGQNADLNAVAAAEARLAACALRTGTTTLAAVAVKNAAGKRRQVEFEWSNYRTTVDVDAIKRNNIRGTWLRLSDDYMTDIRAALSAARDRADAEAIFRELELWIGAAQSRASCFIDGVAPCSRYGLNEPHNHERAMDEIVRGLLPVIGTPDVISRFGAFVWERGDDAVRVISGVPFDASLYGRTVALLRATEARSPTFTPTAPAFVPRRASSGSALSRALR
jgi:hypothetical protein